MTTYRSLHFACAIAALALPSLAAAQDEPREDGGERDSERGERAETFVRPYIEAAQVLTQELSPGDEFVTYSQVAAGVDATVAGRNSAGSVSLRYERRIGYDDSTIDGDTLSGVARASLAIAPRSVTLDAGALAARTRVESSGAASLGGFGGDDSQTSQIYAGYVGPSVHTMAGEVEIEGHYRLGYVRVEEPDALAVAPGQQPVDLLDDSTTHAAFVRAGVRPNTVAPVGVGVGAGWTEQHVSNLDQRVRDRYVRADVTVPVSPSLAVVGGVGYEDVEVSGRDAVRNGAGNAVIGSDGRLVTDTSAPRQIAYETSGLIWDAGVMWRPSRRTSVEAYVGRRYGSMTYHGAAAYAPNSRESFNAIVYDNLTTFGGVLVEQIAGLPTEFEAFRNPISGQVGGCVASAQGGSCFGGSLATLNAGVFRNRGGGVSYSATMGHTQIGTGIGYDRRRFLAASGTAIGGTNGQVDETVWWAAYASTELDQRSSVTANASANWFDSSDAFADSSLGYSASVAYNRNLLRGLSGTAAVAFDGVSRKDLEDFQAASALVGLRYSFF